MKDKPDTLEDYFRLRGNPAATSPIAERMRQLHELYPDLSFDELRTLARQPGEIPAKRKAPLAHHAEQLIDSKPKPKPRLKVDFNRERSGAIFGTGRKAVNN